MRQLNLVGLRIIDQANGHGILTIHAAVAGFFFHAKTDVGNIFQQDWAFGNDQVFQVTHLAILCGDMHKVVLFLFLQCAHIGTRLRVLRKQRAHLPRRNVVGFAGLHVQNHLDGFFLPAEYVYTSNAIQVFQGRCNVFVRNVPNPIHTPASTRLQLHKLAAHLRQVHPVHAHLNSFGQVTLDLIDFLLKFEVGETEINPFLIVNNNGSHAGCDVRLQRLNAFERSHSAFNGNNHLIFEVLRISFLG